MAESILPAASFFARRLKATVTLIHLIEENAPSRSHGESHLKTSDEAMHYLKKVSNRAFPKTVKVCFHVHTTPVRQVAGSIAAHEEEFNHDLILMCTHGRGRTHRLFFGSIAQQVISMGEIPVLLVRPALEQPQPAFALRQMLIPLDGNPVHSQCIPTAVEVARACRAALRLITVVPTLQTLAGTHAAAGKFLPGATRALLDLDEAGATTYLDEVAASLRPDVTVSRAVTRGDPASEIVAEAERLGVELIVLGTHGTVGTEAFWARSVPPKVSGHTRIPVLFVPVSEA